MDIISPLKIDKVVYGGDGLARDNRRVIFLPFVITGETVTAKISKAKKNFANATALRIIDPHPGRITPRCEHFGQCGGCQFQHMDYLTQLEVKKSILLENLGSFISCETIHIDALDHAKWNYRQHIKLGFNKGVLGYHGLSNKNLFKLNQCPIFSDDLNELLPVLTEVLNKAHIEKAEIRLLKQDKNFIACIKSDYVEEIDTSKLLSVFQGVSIHDGHHRRDFGSCQYSQNYLNFKFEMDIWSFIQNHREMAERLYQYVLDQIPQGVISLADLYCGVGVLSILAASKGLKHILGVELNPQSIACAEINKTRHHQNDICFMASPAEHISKHTKAPLEFVIINPPREGISQLMFEELSIIKPPHICYISCNPTTLARDLKKFLQLGYQLKSAKGFDLFPQTTHLETVCLLVFGD